MGILKKFRDEALAEKRGKPAPVVEVKVEVKQENKVFEEPETKPKKKSKKEIDL
jgi:hypothetical protein